MPSPRPPADPGKPTPREALSKASAAAAPKVAKAVEAAGPTVEKAAASAGKLLGTLRDRARETARSFSEGYGSDVDEGVDGSAVPEEGSLEPDSSTSASAPKRRRPRPNRDQP